VGGEAVVMAVKASLCVISCCHRITGRSARGETSIQINRIWRAQIMINNTAEYPLCMATTTQSLCSSARALRRRCTGVAVAVMRNGFDSDLTAMKQIERIIADMGIWH
jgi:hypothetical protein